MYETIESHNAKGGDRVGRGNGDDMGGGKNRIHGRKKTGKEWKEVDQEKDRVGAAFWSCQVGGGQDDAAQSAGTGRESSSLCRKQTVLWSALGGKGQAEIAGGQEKKRGKLRGNGTERVPGEKTT